jgi:hypothetical protein
MKESTTTPKAMNVSLHTVRIVGCSSKMLMVQIEPSLPPGVAWDEWHVSHIVAVAIEMLKRNK